jgi:hypothetical protein
MPSVVWNIFGGASSSYSDVDHYVIRKLLGYVFSIRWEPECPYRKSSNTHDFLSEKLLTRGTLYSRCFRQTTRLHGVTLHKTVIFIVTTMRTSNLACVGKITVLSVRQKINCLYNDSVVRQCLLSETRGFGSYWAASHELHGNLLV